LGSGVVGTAALTGKSVMAMDVTIDHDFKPNPLLPETRCELAVSRSSFKGKYWEFWMYRVIKKMV
jgi:hypothetical protein